MTYIFYRRLIWCSFPLILSSTASYCLILSHQLPIQVECRSRDCAHGDFSAQPRASSSQLKQVPTRMLCTALHRLASNMISSLIVSCATSYYIASCHVILHHVISCYVMSYHVMSCHIMLCHVISYHVMSNHIMLCHVISCYVMLCHIMLCYVMSCHIMLCHVISCYVM